MSFIVLAVTPKRVTIWREHFRVIALVGHAAPFEETLQQWLAVGNIAFYLIGPRFEPQTSRSVDKLDTARPTDG